MRLADLLKPPAYSREFMLLCLVGLLFFSSHHALTPTLPILLQERHINPLATGGILASFMVTSLLVRPILGKITDEYCKKTLMILGLILFLVCPALYLWATLEWHFYAIRILHGLGFAMLITAMASYVIFTLPPNHKAEGLGFHNNAIKLALCISPAVALFFLDHHWMTGVFYLASLLGFMTLGVVMLLTPTATSPGDTPTKPGVMVKGKLLNTKALFPGLVNAGNSVLFGAVVPFVPLIAQEKHLGSVALFYVLYAIALMATRVWTGPISDSEGRTKVVIPGMVASIVAFLLMSWAPNAWLFYACAILYGLATGAVLPSLTAMVADRIEPYERGSAMATFTALSDLGLAVGNFIVGTLGALWGYSAALPVVTLFTAAGVTALWLKGDDKKPVPLSPA